MENEIFDVQNTVDTQNCDKKSETFTFGDKVTFLSDENSTLVLKGIYLGKEEFHERNKKPAHLVMFPYKYNDNGGYRAVTMKNPVNLQHSDWKHI